MDHAVVQRWLRSVLSPYGDEDRVFADVDRTLLAVPSLTPKTEVYTFDDGRAQLLLELTGTIPITYRNAMYNIPMALWIPRAYPREPPVAYVTPTSDMLVRKGVNVDVSGRVGGVYLQQWARKWEACNLLELIHACQGMFAQEPPVYAKPRVPPATSVPVASPSSSPSASTSVIGQSTALRSASTLTDPRDRGPPPAPGSSTRPDGVPLRPPKPGQRGDEVARRASSGTSYGDAWARSPQSAAKPPPPLSASPQSGTYGAYVSEPQSFAGPSYTRSGPQSRSGSWSGSGAGDYSPRAPSQLQTTPSGGMTNGSAPPPLPPNPHAAKHFSYSYSNGDAREREPHTNGSPAAPGPAPPRPPNPELLRMHNALRAKLHARLQHMRAKTDEANGQLRLLCDDLDRGDAAIKDEMARLEAVRDVCRATGDELESSVQAAHMRTSDLRAREDPDVDGLICATSLAGNQLIDLVAEDNAIEDTLYHLGRALHAEVIDLDRFLKQTRYLAREQFMRRALAQKISAGMGWA